MLKYRIMTAIILVPLFFALLFYLSPTGFSALLSGLFLWAVWEWTSLMGLTKISHRFCYLVLFVLCAVLFLCASIYIPYFGYGFFAAIFIWWLIATLLILIYPKASEAWSKGVIWRGIMGFLVLYPCWLALNVIRNYPDGIKNIIILLLLIWAADTGAYFIGKRFGKTQLAPRVSPGKTWEGTIGGILSSLVIMVIALLYGGAALSMWPLTAFIVVVTISFSVVGDLFESMLKRQVGIKDSGRLLPGHGGMLDRIDSLTSAAPIYLFLLLSAVLYLSG